MSTNLTIGKKVIFSISALIVLLAAGLLIKGYLWPTEVAAQEIPTLNDPALKGGAFEERRVSHPSYPRSAFIPAMNSGAFCGIFVKHLNLKTSMRR